MQKLQLSIPEPCHENWQNMTPTDQGRFCKACAKEVVDFSMMTDTEVLNYFTSLTHDKVCGRALPSQLERTISKPKDPKKRLFWYWNYLVMFFMFFTKGNGAKAQAGIKPLTELSPVMHPDIKGEMQLQDKSRIISGKITDAGGNPVSFASIKIKGTSRGVAADANGAYSLIIKAGVILEISGAGFITREIPTGTQSAVNTVLEKTKGGTIGEMIIVTTGAIRRNPDEYYGPYDRLKRVAVIHVKDEETGKVIPNAGIVIQEGYVDIAYSFITDNKGVYKIKGISDYNKYEIKVSANGYEPSEFTIDDNDFKDRKKTWQVLLRKQKNESVRSTARPKLGLETTIRLGGINAFAVRGSVLYVVDGTILLNNVDINSDDVADYFILSAPEAMAIFGESGKNGAIVISTRKAKEITLKEVIVNTGGFTSCSSMAGGISFTNTYENSFLGDTIATVKTLLTDSVKVYPNPVQRNTGFSVALKLKQAGNYSLQVNDASGRILLLQKFNAGSKNHTEKIMSDSRWLSGIYYIRVFDAQNKLVSKSGFTVQ
jgi:hypothetical protein